MSEIVERARALRGTIEALAETLDDGAALEAKELYPLWSGEGVSYTAGQRLRHNGKLYKVNDGQSHVSQPGWAPDIAVSLFAEILPGQDGTEIGEWVQPDSTNTYKKGDRVYHNGKLWESVVDGPNSWEPGVFGWEEVTEE